MAIEKLNTLLFFDIATMGRYTSVQTFTDQSTKVIQTSSSSNSSSSSSNATGISVGTSNNNVKIYKTLDTVDNVSGSTAGAGSNEFHLYNNARSREMLRVEVMNDELLGQFDGHLH